MAHASPTPQASGSSAADSIDEQLGMQGIVQKLIDAMDTDNDSDEPPEPSTNIVTMPSP